MIPQFPVKDPKGFYLSGRTTLFAARVDQRFSYCLHVPRAHTPDGPPLPLVVLVHGTARTGPQYRDAFSEWAEEHGCVVLCPLFPAGIGGQDDLHGYKFLRFGGVDYDRVLLAIVDEVTDRFNVERGPFLLHGFSGGGQFTHRFLYLHPDRLAAASVGAPGRVTLLDDARTWWLGTGDFAERFGRRVDIDAVRRVPVQLVVGEKDTETWEINNIGDPNWLDGAEATGRTRIERITALYENYLAHRLDVRLDVVPGAGHRGSQVRPAVMRYFSERLAART